MIKFKTLTGKEIEIDFEPTDTIDRIKERVEEKEGIPPVQQSTTPRIWRSKWKSKYIHSCKCLGNTSVAVRKAGYNGEQVSVSKRLHGNSGSRVAGCVKNGIVQPHGVNGGLPDDSGHLKLADFGVSELLNGTNAANHKKLMNYQHTTARRYVAHEVFRNEDYDTKADVFSFSLILQEEEFVKCVRILKRPNASALVLGTRDRVNLHDKFKQAIEAYFPGTIDELTKKVEERKADLEKPSFWESVKDSNSGGNKFSF
ncbi:hypothetical protein SSX86_011560 [Deinandra increscens subsp. villosa]|uniref:Ubiquitin-like domain-containing protein n=1 Tax=Deinandra increscens subsp. villosa TaxID=3103831 RepID=A0AAP0D6T9_9ASTR